MTLLIKLCCASLAAAFLISVPRAFAQQGGVAVFEDVSVLLGPLPAQKSYGTTWSDFEGDGWPDLFLNNHNGAAPYVLQNNSGTSFTNIAVNSALGKKVDHHSCKWSDYDRDTDWDLYCSTGDNGNQGRMRLLRNRGDGIFDEVAAETGTQFVGGRGRAVSWFDMDNDGDLDLFVGTVTTSPSEPQTKIFRNDGLAFTDVTTASGVVLGGWARIAIPLDIDQDDDTDLLVSFSAKNGATFPCTNCIVILRNEGSGRFDAINGQTRGLTGSQHQALAIGDYDNDGDLDVFQGTAVPSAALHRNNGNSTFTQVSLAAVGMSAVDDFPVMDAQWADFDNDGFLDLYVVRHHQNEVSNAPNNLFVNNGNGTFTDLTSQFNAAGLATGRGDAAAIADFDKNGFLDLVISNGFQEVRGNYQLLRNSGNGNHWLRLVLTSTSGSPEFGSKVWVTAGGSVQFREYGDNGGAAASNEHVLHFGLGASELVDQIRVRWPDGSITDLTGVGSGQQLEIQRSPAGPAEIPVPDLVGLSREAAETAIQAAGLIVGTVSTTASESVPEGYVISHLPGPNATVTVGTSVSLLISTGSLPLTVPDVVDLPQAAAESALVAIGLVLGTVSTASSETVAAGLVISQEPAAGSSVVLGAVISLVVSIGPPTVVAVPDVVGSVLSEAETAIQNAGLVIGTISTETSESVPAGTVISQDPAAGSNVAPGASISLVVSLGPPAVVAVPDVVGSVLSEAQAAIQNAGLVVGTIGSATSESVPAGNVISQDPGADSIVSVGASITLLVSIGPTAVTVPNVLGLTQNAATDAIEVAGLIAGSISTASSDTVPAGLVISQEPAGGASVTSGSSVTLVISVGQPTIAVPDVVGQLQESAVVQLSAVGLSVGDISFTNSDTVPADQVISQNPAGGVHVAPGTTVALVISAGLPAVTVPDVVGLSQGAAESQITAAGLSIGSIGLASSDSVPEGLVISQNPPGNSVVTIGMAVALVISSGPIAVNAYLDFDGANDVVTIPHSTSLQFASSVTVEAWIRPRTIANNLAQDRILKKGNNYELTISTGDTGCAGNTSGHVQWRATIGGASGRICGGILIPGMWHHIAGTFNGTAFILYVDGSEVARRNRSGSMALGTTSLVVGNNETRTRGFNGGIDSVVVWSRALSASEIQERFASTPNGTENGLAGLWKFDEASGQSLFDAGPNSNHGFLGIGNGAENSDPVREQ